MKKQHILVAAMLALCLAFALAACGEGGGDSGNDSKTAEPSKPAEGSGCEFDFPRTGFGFDLPEGMEITKGYLFPYDIGEVEYQCGIMEAWPVYVDMTKEEYDALTEEDAGRLHSSFSFQIICVKDAASADEAKEKCLALMKKENEELDEEQKKAFEKMEEVHKEDGYIWMLLRSERAQGLQEGCQEEYDAFYDATDEIISSMEFYEPKIWRGGEEGADVVFETTDLDGNPVDSGSLFAKNKVTMINIWATTCGPCVEEMPELERLNKEWAKRGGAVVGLVDDVTLDNNTYLDDAQEIVSDTGVTYTNIRSWDGYTDVLSKVGTPTTYFVDSKGKLIGEPVLGANPKQYKEKMEEYLSQAE